MRRMVRKVIEGLLIALFCASVTTALACGAEPAPPSPAVTTTNAAASLLVIQDYKSQLEDWATTFLQDADVDAFVGLQHPLRPTAEELKRARDFTAYTRRMLSALREITPPPEVAAAHYQYVDCVAAEIGALDRLLLGLESGNERDLELAFRDASAARIKELQALSALSPYLDLPALTQN